VSLTNATLPSIEEIVIGAIPGLPKVVPHWPLVDYQVGDKFMQWFWKADAGEIDSFVLVVEGSVPNEKIKDEGYWSGFGDRRGPQNYTRHARPSEADTARGRDGPLPPGPGGNGRRRVPRCGRPDLRRGHR